MASSSLPATSTRSRGRNAAVIRIGSVVVTSSNITTRGLIDRHEDDLANREGGVAVGEDGGVWSRP